MDSEISKLENKRISKREAYMYGNEFWLVGWSSTINGTSPLQSRIFVLAGSLKKNQNAPRPSEQPQSGGKNVKTFRWDQ